MDALRKLSYFSLCAFLALISISSYAVALPKPGSIYVTVGAGWSDQLVNRSPWNGGYFPSGNSVFNAGSSQNGIAGHVDVGYFLSPTVSLELGFNQFTAGEYDNSYYASAHPNPADLSGTSETSISSYAIDLALNVWQPLFQSKHWLLNLKSGVVYVHSHFKVSTDPASLPHDLTPNLQTNITNTNILPLFALGLAYHINAQNYVSLQDQYIMESGKFEINYPDNTPGYNTVSLNITHLF